MPSKSNNLVFALLKKEPSLFSFLKIGDIVKGKVLKKEGHKRLFIDLGRYGLGAVYGRELLNAKEIVKDLKIGDQIFAKVVNVDNEEGLIELSITDTNKQALWNELMELKEQEAILTIVPKAFNKGGLVTEVNGLQGFLPLSQLAPSRFSSFLEETENQEKNLQILQSLIGQELKVKILEVNPRNKKLILSEKAVSGPSFEEISKSYQVGQIVEGIVSGIANFGVFVKFTDNPAIEGLIETSELSHRLIENPKEIVKIDQVIKAKIINFKENRIYLSLKALTPNPWEKVNEYYRKDQVVKGRVYLYLPFGAIINLDHELQGQIHISEFGGSLEELKKNLKEGEIYEFVIAEIKPQEKRIILKRK